MRGRGMLLVLALVLSAGLLLFLSSQPTGLAAQASPLAPDSPLAAAPEATATAEPTATATHTTTPTPAATATATATPTPTATAATATAATTTAATATAATPSATPTRRTVAATTSGSIEQLDVDAFDAFIAAARRTFDVPGAAVAVIVGDEVLLAAGYGVRQLGAEAAVDADTRFVLGSASHLLLASAVAALADAGVLELDRPVVEYLPEFALYDGYAGDHTTLRDLLAHRTGLPADTGDLLDKLGLDRSAALAQMQYLPPAVSFRGQEGFSNLGVFAAAEVLDAVEGKPWEEIVAERVFTPLGMARSSGYYDALLEDDNVAAAHFDAGNGCRRRRLARLASPRRRRADRRNAGRPDRLAAHGVGRR
jgi:CubicO group peptidase (beta-lactamase class C family)